MARKKAKPSRAQAAMGSPLAAPNPPPRITVSTATFLKKRKKRKGK
jgi:hypothetical protein